MKEQIIEIITKETPETKYIDGANAADEILALFDVRLSFEEGYKKGYIDAQLEATKEIEKNYKPNENN